MCCRPLHLPCTSPAPSPAIYPAPSPRYIIPNLPLHLPCTFPTHYPISPCTTLHLPCAFPCYLPCTSPALPCTSPAPSPRNLPLRLPCAFALFHRIRLTEELKGLRAMPLWELDPEAQGEETRAYPAGEPVYAEMYPRCRRDVPEMSPRCTRDVADRYSRDRGLHPSLGEVEVTDVGRHLFRIGTSREPPS